MGRFMEGLFEVTAPPFIGGVVSGDSASALGDIPLVSEAVSLATNKDLRTGRDIVPKHQLGLEPALQYSAYNSALAREIGGQLNISPAVIDHAISGFGGSWGDIIKNFSTGISNEEGLFGATVDSTITRRFLRDASRGATSSRQFWNTVGDTTGTFARVSNTYKNLLDTAGEAEASAYLDRMGEDERAYALLNAHFKAEAKRLHPLRRAQDAIETISKMRKDIAGQRLEMIEDKETPITLTPSQRQMAQDILGKIEMVEARNALIVMKAPGWEQRQPMDLQSLHADLAIALPEIEEEWLARAEKNKIYDAESVKEFWPDVRERILTDRQDANFDDLVAGAK